MERLRATPLINMVHYKTVPVRFLSLTSHLTINLLLFWAREPHVLACIPNTSAVGSDEYTTKDIQLLVGLSLSLLFIIGELLGFLTGLSMFSELTNLFSIAAHAVAAITLTVFITQVWSCDSFWYIFAFCSALPLLVEITVITATLKLKVFL